MRSVLVYFSPTKGTKKILEKINEGLNIEATIEIDLCKPLAVQKKLNEDDICIFGAPNYGGRIPAFAIEQLRKLSGKGQPTICAVTYGNKSYGNALADLMNIVSNQGFKVISAGTFVSEHSFSNDKREIGINRPNNVDYNTAKTLGKKSLEKMEQASANINDFNIKVPGKVPKGKPLHLPRMESRPLENCTLCLKCKQECPINAIDHQAKCDDKKCIACFACVKGCPEKARELKHPIISLISFAISFSKDKESKMFI